MRYILPIFIFLFISTNSYSYDWGQKGHRTTAAIAEHYLNRRTKKHLKDLLGEETLVTVSTYADEIKSYSEFKKYSPWHYVNITLGKTYAVDSKNPSGDLYMAIEECKKVLKSEESSKEDKIFYLKFLVHLLGDLHQPLHVGKAEDQGGNKIQVRWFNDGTNLHSVWDTKMIESYGMSYSELADNYGARDKDKYKAISSGSVMDWVNEGRALADTVYASAKVGEKLSYRYQADNFEIITEQLEKGGIRLASILNEIFG